ncbi:MAG TPA: hypothetical protein DCW90_13085 [Lachnospiraceae bacterium]|nr:DivIVA domain-containing protein [uncultured Lachnoclostridium sp.]HAU86386.1 hypothetical protein [Lachnospiraceae bacterium]
MLTPIEIQGIIFKTGRGYKKDDVDSFMKALHHDYEIMYKENKELKEKVTTLSEGVQYYKNLEKTLQKALVLAEKTSEETKIAAQKHAEAIENEARLKADHMLYEARQEVHQIEAKAQELLQNFELYKVQFKQILNSQMELVNSSTFDIMKKEFDLPACEKEENQSKEPKDVKLEVKETLDTKKPIKEPVNEEKKSTTPKTPDVFDIEKELASSIVEIEKEAKTELKNEVTVNKEDPSENGKKSAPKHSEMETEVKTEAKTDTKTESEIKTESDTADDETDLEIKMLQKLLNEIKKNNEPDANDEEFEFINTDTDE